MGHDVVSDYRKARRLLGRRAAGAGVRSVLHRPRDAALPGRLLRHRRCRRLDRRDPRAPRPHVEGECEHARAVRRDEATRAGRPGAGPQAAGDRARRADGGRRRRAAAKPVGVHPPAESRGPHGDPHDALSRGSRGAVRADRDDEGRSHRRARHQAEPAVAVRGPHRAPGGAAAAAALVRARAAAGGGPVRPRAVEPCASSSAARRPAQRGDRDRGPGARRNRSRAGVPAHHARRRRAHGIATGIA